MGNWGEYHKFVAETPNHLVQSVVESVPCGRDAALDLGAGNLRDSRFLKRRGFKKIVAVDSSIDSRIYESDGIELVIEEIERYRLGRNRYDLIISCNTLFFVRKSEIEELMQKIHAALRPNGVLACNLLGDLDPWATDPRKSAFTWSEVALLTQRFKVETFGNFQQILPTASGGEKFWHTWTLVLRKP
jgi:SAM-dependent methyltransferase